MLTIMLLDSLLSFIKSAHFDIYFSQEEEVDEMEQWLKSTEVCYCATELSINLHLAKEIWLLLTYFVHLVVVHFFASLYWKFFA